MALVDALSRRASGADAARPGRAAALRSRRCCGDVIPRITSRTLVPVSSMRMPAVMTQPGVEASVYNSEWSPSGRTCVCTLSTGEVLVVDGATMLPVGRLRGHEEGCNVASFLDEHSLFTGSDDATCRQWDLRMTEAIPGAAVAAARRWRDAVSRSGEAASAPTAASAAADHLGARGAAPPAPDRSACVRVYRGHDEQLGWVKNCAPLCGGLVLTAAFDGTIRIWDSRAGAAAPYFPTEGPWTWADPELCLLRGSALPLVGNVALFHPQLRRVAVHADLDGGGRDAKLAVSLGSSVLLVHGMRPRTLAADLDAAWTSLPACGEGEPDDDGQVGLHMLREWAAERERRGRLADAVLAGGAAARAVLGDGEGLCPWETDPTSAGERAAAACSAARRAEAAAASAALGPPARVELVDEPTLGEALAMRFGGGGTRLVLSRRQAEASLAGRPAQAGMLECHVIQTGGGRRASAARGAAEVPVEDLTGLSSEDIAVGMRAAARAPPLSDADVVAAARAVRRIVARDARAAEAGAAGAAAPAGGEGGGQSEEAEAEACGFGGVLDVAAEEAEAEACETGPDTGAGAGHSGGRAVPGTATTPRALLELGSMVRAVDGRRHLRFLLRFWEACAPRLLDAVRSLADAVAGDVPGEADAGGQDGAEARDVARGMLRRGDNHPSQWAGSAEEAWEGTPPPAPTEALRRRALLALARAFAVPRERLPVSPRVTLSRGLLVRWVCDDKASGVIKGPDLSRCGRWAALPNGASAVLLDVDAAHAAWLATGRPVSNVTGLTRAAGPDGRARAGRDGGARGARTEPLPVDSLAGIGPQAGRAGPAAGPEPTEAPTWVPRPGSLPLLGLCDPLPDASGPGHEPLPGIAAPWTGGIFARFATRPGSELLSRRVDDPVLAAVVPAVAQGPSAARRSLSSIVLAARFAPSTTGAVSRLCLCLDDDGFVVCEPRP